MCIFKKSLKLARFNTAENYIKNLKLIRHPEGGYYAEFYRSNDSVIPLSQQYSLPKEKITSKNDIHNQRSASTSIYFLLEKNDFSAFHRIKSDEIWHYYDGNSPIHIHIINGDGNYQTQILGNPITTEGASFQVVVKAGSWFAAEVFNKSSFGLVGCTVSPGFDFKDFELANRDSLVALYPKHCKIIEKLTRIEQVGHQEAQKHTTKKITCKL